MAVRVERQAFGDPRLGLLAKELGLADGDHARAKVEWLWLWCTDQNTTTLDSETIAQALGERGADALVRAKLATKLKTGYRIAGTKGRIEWLETYRKNGRKGGRPKKPTGSDGGKPGGSGNQNPNATSPAPSPPTKESERSPDWGRAAMKAAEAIWYEHCDRHASLFPDVQPRLLRLPTTQGCRDLRARADDYAALGDIGLAQFEADARHVLAVQEADAKAKRDPRYFGEGVWRAQNFATAKSIKAKPASQSAATAPVPFVRRSCIPDGDDE